MIAIRLLPLLLTLASLQACDLFEHDHTPNYTSPLSCSADDYNQYIYDSMKRYYFWYDSVDPDNTINPRDMVRYPTANDLVDALRFNPPDRFSHISDAASFNQLYAEGVFLGTGLRLLTDSLSGDLMVAYAFDGSPAHIAGIRRGDQIVKINNTLANGLLGLDWSNAWGADEVGTEVQLEVRTPPNDIPRPITLTKELVSINTTQKSTIIDTGSSKIAYLHFTNFLGTKSITELSNQFTTFQNSQVNELIVDLRYNGGGSVSTARYLGSLIGGSTTAGNIFTRLVFNNKSNGYNGHTETFSFQSAAESLELNRVFFITTGASCSASELVINSLLPFNSIEKIVIGDTTCGKPAGSKPDTACGKTFSAINFEIRNAYNVGGYYDGIGPGFAGLNAFCEATDNIGFPLGDSMESSIASAIDYMQGGACNAVFNKQISFRNPPIRSETNARYTSTEGLY